MMRTNRVRLRHVRIEDYPTLHAIESDPTTAATWRYRGALPPLSEYEPALWKQTQAIMVVESIATGDLHGYLQLYDVDWRAPHGWFSLYAGPEHRGSGSVLEGFMLFTEWVFANFAFPWLYAHAFAHNLDQFSSAFRRGVAVLGVLQERVVVDGELTDVTVLGVERSEWFAAPTRQRMLRLQARLTEAEAEPRDPRSP